MSAFNRQDKDDICESIRSFIKENSDLKPSEILEQVMEAVTYGLRRGFEDIEE
jgi:hypothetical protein